jgi:hypothetical protein
VVNTPDFVLARRRGLAGEVRAARCFGRRIDASFYSANEQMEVVKGSAVSREKGWEEEEGTNLLRSAYFVWGRPQVQATPARNRR